MSFEKAVAFVLQSEGGYVNHPSDPGGETNFGISKRSYPDEDIKGMTVDRAKEIYKRDYWDALSCDMLPDGIATVLFDTAVNCGHKPAARMLQRACGVSDDGIIGKVTIAYSSKEGTLERFLAERAVYYAKLTTFNVFGLGWMRRLIKLARYV